MMISLKTKNYPLKTNKAFTLIELLLYFGLASVVIGIVTSVFVYSLSAKVKNQTIAEVDGNGNQIVELISNTIRNANTINSPLTGSNASTLSLNTYTAGLNPTVFNFSSGIISITEGTGAAVNLTSNRVTASNVLFENISYPSSPGVVRFSFTLTHNNPSGRNEYNYSKTFYATASLR